MILLTIAPYLLLAAEVVAALWCLAVCDVGRDGSRV